MKISTQIIKAQKLLRHPLLILLVDMEYTQQPSPLVFTDSTPLNHLYIPRYLVNVYFNGSHIPNSPFKVRVCNPEAIWAEGPGLMDSFVGDQGDFQVFTRDAGHGTLSK